MPSLTWAADGDRCQEILPQRPWGSNCLPPLSLRRLPSDCRLTNLCNPGSLTEGSLSASASVSVPLSNSLSCTRTHTHPVASLSLEPLTHTSSHSGTWDSQQCMEGHLVPTRCCLG